jgi:hypothetical protein
MTNTDLTFTEEPLELVASTAVALIEKGDQALDKAEEFYKSAGIRIAECKRRKPDEVSWAEFCKQHFNFGRRRADELIMIGDGRKTLKEVRQEKADGVKRLRALRSASPKANVPIVEPPPIAEPHPLDIPLALRRTVTQPEPPSKASEPEMPAVDDSPEASAKSRKAFNALYDILVTADSEGYRAELDVHIRKYAERSLTARRLPIAA